MNEAPNITEIRGNVLAVCQQYIAPVACASIDSQTLCILGERRGCQKKDKRRKAALGGQIPEIGLRGGTKQGSRGGVTSQRRG